MPIVPNFILKLEEAAENPKNLLNDTSSVEYIVICSNRTTSNDTSWNGPNFKANYDVNIHKPVICKKTRVVNETAENILREESRQEEYEEYGDANVKAGIMFGSKALVQMLFNPFVGPVTNR